MRLSGGLGNGTAYVSRRSLPATSGLNRFKNAVNKVRKINLVAGPAQKHHEAEEKNHQREAKTFHHRYEWMGAASLFLHVFNVFMSFVLLQIVWTYDGLDAANLVDSYALRGSQYDHFYAHYYEVEEIGDFKDWLPWLQRRLIGDTTKQSPILRYQRDEKIEETCVPQYRNQSYPMEGDPSTKSHSYKVFRPLPNWVDSAVSARSMRSSAYLSDGIVIRQLRGKLNGGYFEQNKRNHPPCGMSSYHQPVGVKWFMYGRYFWYPADEGYDLFYNAEGNATAMQEHLRSALDCGWIDRETRAVIVMFTITMFLDNAKLESQMPLSKNMSAPLEPTVVDEGSAYKAFGPYVEVPVQILFEIPSTEAIRSYHKMAVVDRSYPYSANIEVHLVIVLTVINLFVIIMYGIDMMHSGVCHFLSFAGNLLQILGEVLFFAAVIAFTLANSGQITTSMQYNEAKKNPEMAAQFCSPARFVTINSQRTAEDTFLMCFSYYLAILIWRTLSWFTVFPRIMIPITALVNAGREVLSFAVVYVILIFGFAVGAHMQFGEVYQFRSLSSSMLTMVLVSVDELDADDIFTGTQHRDYPRLYMFAFRLIAVTIFLNIFVAIILVQYEIARGESRAIQDHMHRKFLSSGLLVAGTVGHIGDACVCRPCRGKRTSGPESHAGAGSKKKSAETCHTAARRHYRAWYHRFRQRMKNLDEHPPLRHDTEVIMKSIRHIGVTSLQMQADITLLSQKVESLQNPTSGRISGQGPSPGKQPQRQWAGLPQKPSGRRSGARSGRRRSLYDSFTQEAAAQNKANRS